MLKESHLIPIFCEIDDFCKELDKNIPQTLLTSPTKGRRGREKHMELISKLPLTGLASTLFCISSLSFAGTMSDKIDPSPFQGFYVGAGIVGANMNNTVTINSVVSGGSEGIPTSLLGSASTNNTGFIAAAGRLNLDYGYLFNQAYVGAEVTYRYSPTPGGASSNGQNIIEYFTGIIFQIVA